MNETKPVYCEQDARVTIITLNRPDALNAMNNAVFAAVADALLAAESAPDTAVAVITGAGRAFCAGQDLTEMQALLDGQGDVHEFPRMLETLTNFNKPLLAAVNGLGVGIGMTLLAHCDLVFMADDAKLRTPFPQLGLAPEAGSSVTFAERMGWQNAAYTLLSGRWFSAAQCRDMGLVWRLAPAPELMAQTLAVAHELAANPIPSLVATKRLMLDGGRATQALAAHAREMQAYEAMLGAPANAEAVRAFREKRAPDFSGLEGV